MNGGEETTDPTPHVLGQVRTTFGDRFVAGRVLAEQEAVALLNSRAGSLDRDEAMRLGQLFNTHELAGRVRQDRFSPAFAGATMQRVTEEQQPPVDQGTTTSFDQVLEAFIALHCISVIPR